MISLKTFSLRSGFSQTIEMVQRRAARWVSNQYSSYDSVAAMLSNLGWRSLEYRHYDSRLAMFYKIQYGLVAVQMLSYFEPRKRITRHSQYNPLGFRQVFAHTDYYRRSFYPMTIVLWNRGSLQKLYFYLILTLSRGR